MTVNRFGNVLVVSSLFFAVASFAVSRVDGRGPMRTHGSDVAAESVAPTLVTRIVAPAALDEGHRGTFRFTITNESDFAATNVSLIAWVGTQALSAVVVNAPDWRCDYTGAGRTSCTVAALAAGATKELVIAASYPRRYVRLDVAVRVYSDFPPGTIAPDNLTILPVIYYRDYVVRNTNDAGAESLRDAITRANFECEAELVPCRIAFDLPRHDSTSRVQTIRPLEPLPPIVVSDVSVDGETQTSTGGDTNAAGPEVALDGSALTAGDGLTFDSAFVVVQGLAIGGFPENGIRTSFRRPARITIRRNHLGIDATGRAAMPNAQRGLAATNAGGEIADNVVSGNGRSGIWLSGAASMTVRRNRIGLAAHANDAVPNGASGIFFGGNGAASFSENLVIDNVIAFNGHFGIGVTANLSGTVIDANTITANAQGGIDVGVDGPTPARAPVVTSARYDATTGLTTIEGTRVLALGIDRSRILVYANTSPEPAGTSEGEMYLGTATTEGTRFTLTVAGDWRGRWIDAMQIAVADFGDGRAVTSSEFGPAVRIAD